MGMTQLIKKYIKGDPIIWVVILMLSVMSLLAIYSSTGTLAYKFQGGNTMYYMLKHFVFLLLGFGIIVGTHLLSYKYYARYALPLIWVAIGLLGVTLLTGNNLNQASRWLTVPGVGISFQPSEFAKLALIIYIAKELAKHQEDGVPAYSAFKPIMIYVGLVCGLIFREDFSTAGLIGATAMMLMFIGRVPFKYLAGTIGVMVAIMALIISLSSHVPFLHRAETWKARIERFVSSDDEAKEKNEGHYQSERSKMAVATGGFVGKGPGNSIQRNFLPHPYSDFIYAIIIEEWGALGGFIIMLCYMILLFRAGVIVRASSRTFPAFLAIGLTMLLVFQAFINMGVAVGVLPVTGQTLPLVSMGGTSVLFTCVAFGAILSVSRNNIEEAEALRKKSAA